MTSLLALDMVVLALAVIALMNLWFKSESGLLARARSYFEARGGIIGEHMTCPICLPVSLTLILALLFIIPAYLPLYSPLVCLLTRFPVYLLAAVGLIHVYVEATNLGE